MQGQTGITIDRALADELRTVQRSMIVKAGGARVIMNEVIREVLDVFYKATSQSVNGHEEMIHSDSS